jgi:hypothetical protein
MSMSTVLSSPGPRSTVNSNGVSVSGPPPIWVSISLVTSPTVIDALAKAVSRSGSSRVAMVDRL